jgi:MFS transporter, BCD family, chlorophyll transporter
LAWAGLSALPNWPLRANVFVLGVANGAFSIAAIGSMMALAGGASQSSSSSAHGAHHARSQREGTRMGLWGAAQAIGFAGGGLIGAATSDALRWLLGSPGVAYAGVFAAEALLFVLAARIASGLAATQVAPSLSSEPVLAKEYS